MSEPAAPSSLKRRLVLALLAAFACGLLSGGAGMWLAARRGMGPFCPAGHGPERPHRPPENPEDMPLRLADKLCEELKLEEKLRAPIRQIFREGFASSEPLRQRMSEEMKTHFAHQNDKIRALLNPEQISRFDALLAEWEKQHRPGGPPPPR